MDLKSCDFPYFAINRDNINPQSGEVSAANNLASGLSGNRPDDEVDETVGFQLVQEEKPEEPKLEADEVVDETATCNKGGSESEESGDDDEALLARLQV